jgi:hypothetical protein
MKTNLTKSRLIQSLAIIRSQNGLIAGRKKLVNVISEIWLFDWKRPGIQTGLQTVNEILPADYMWYSPTETTVCFEMLGFTKEWIRSYYEYSSNDTVVSFVDFGAGAGKTNMIARELGYPLSIAFELDQELVSIADSNFTKHRKRQTEAGIIQTIRGDVTDVTDMRLLRVKIISAIPEGRKILLVAYNKNSYGSSALKKKILALDEVFESYVYLYQNPVHKKVLENMGLNVHRHIQDAKLRKNRDWLIATRDK